MYDNDDDDDDDHTLTAEVIIIIIIIIIRNLFSAIMPLGGYRGAGGTGR